MVAVVVVVAGMAVAGAEAARMKTTAATAMAGVTDNNQPKLSVEEMAAEIEMATVTTTTMARTKMAVTMAVVAAAFLHDRQQSTKRGSRSNGCNNVDSDGNSDADNGQG